MKKSLFYLFSFVLVVVLISACGGDKGTKNEDNIASKNELKKGVDTSSQNSVKEPEKAFIQVFSSSGVVFDQPCQSKIIVCVKSGVVKAIHTNCEDEYALFDFLEGEADELKFSGKGSFFDNCGGSDPSQTMCKSTKNFKMELSKDSTKLKFNGKNYSKSSSKISFKTKVIKLYASPDLSTKLIEINKDVKSKVELLEIGNLQKKGSEWGIWYNVKVDEKEGWCLDCLNL
jgi:hypothetical protein